jgi:hypothetical protein
LSGSAGTEQRGIWEKSGHGLHIRDLLGAAANDLPGLD